MPHLSLAVSHGPAPVWIPPGTVHHFPPTKPGFGVTVLIFHGAALVTVAPDRHSPLYGLNASELLIERRKTTKIHNN
jgi:hypothetical protein